MSAEGQAAGTVLTTAPTVAAAVAALAVAVLAEAARAATIREPRADDAL